MRKITVAAVQTTCSDDLDDNVARMESKVREAIERGAMLVVPHELFEGLYFCQDIDAIHKQRARPFEGHPTIERFRQLAEETGCVIPVSFFERDGDRYFNSLAMIDADGRVIGLYRKSHIPDGPGYSEKYYFQDGDTGLKVFETSIGRVGVGICWDQWQPEQARALTLMGAEILLYPTAIGSEPADPAWDSRGHWQRVMQGHAAANIVPVIAANRVGIEYGVDGHLVFYGSSFITDHTGHKLAEADRVSETVITAEVDLDAADLLRRKWGVFRDRRPALYAPLREPTPEFLMP